VENSGIVLLVVNKSGGDQSVSIPVHIFLLMLKEMIVSNIYNIQVEIEQSKTQQ
jgi:hypothetical protein